MPGGSPNWDPPIMLPGLGPQGVPLYASPLPSRPSQTADLSNTIGAFNGICGYEVANIGAYAPVGGSSLSSTVAGGTIAFDTVTFRAPGVQALTATKTAAGDSAYHNIIFPNAGNRATFRGYFQLSALPSTGTGIIWASYSSNTPKVSVQVTTAGVVQILTAAGASNTTATIAAGTMYRLDVSFDMSANPWAVNIAITAESTNTVLCSQSFAPATAASTFDRFRVGIIDLVATAFAATWDDLAWQINDTTIYPIGAGYIILAVPTAVGRHQYPTRFFDHLGNTLTAADTTSYQEIDDPGTAVDTATYVTQNNTDNRTSEVPPNDQVAPYLEYLLGTVAHNTGIMAASDVPRCVNVIKASCGSSVSTNRTQQFWVVDAFDSRESVIVRQSITGTALVYTNLQLPGTPAGRRWTDADVAGLRLRYGYGAANVSNNQRLSFFGAEIEYLGSVVDSGQATITISAGGTETQADQSHGQSGTAGNGLGGNNNHPAFTADMMYLEKYTFTDGVAVSQYQWQLQGTNGTTEHWKLTVYRDNGSGSLPDVLYYQGVEQSYAVVGAGTQTASVSPTDLTIPAGVFWIGVHLKEANAAPTHTGGGTVVDAPDTYTDGALDPFANGVADTNLRDALITFTLAPSMVITASKVSEAIVDQGEGTLSFTATESESQSDSGSGTVSFTTTGSETLVDQAADTVTFTATGVSSGIDSGETSVSMTTTGSEAIADQGSDTATFTPSGADVLADTGSDTVSFTATASEALVDQGDATVVFDATGSYSVTTSDVTDAGEDTISFNTAGSEAIADQGADTLSFTATGSEAIADSRTVNLALTTSGSQALADSATVNVILAVTQAEAIVDRGTDSTLVISTASEAIALSGSATAAFTVSGSGAIADQGAATIAFTPVGSYTTSDTSVATVTFTVTHVEAITDLGGDTVTLTPASAEALAETAAAALVLVPDGAGDVSLADTGIVEIGSDIGQREAIADQGADTVTFTTSARVRIIRQRGYAHLIDSAAPRIAVNTTQTLTPSLADTPSSTAVLAARGGRHSITDAPVTLATLEESQ